MFSALIAFAFSCARPDSALEITFSHILSDQSEWHTGAEHGSKSGRTGDEIRIRIINHSSLSNSNQSTELQMVQAGTLGGSWESSILLSLSDQRWTVWSMPWMFRSYEHAEALCAGDLGQEMLNSLEQQAIVGLGYGFNGFRRLTNSGRAVASLSDMNALKIRVPSLQMFISLYRIWGADPSQMNFGDLIVALKEGAMDGQENPCMSSNPPVSMTCRNISPSGNTPSTR